MNVIMSQLASKHEGFSYPRDEYDYAAITSGNLKKHKESEGVRYPCDECGYVATQSSNL